MWTSDEIILLRDPGFDIAPGRWTRTAARTASLPRVDAMVAILTESNKMKSMLAKVEGP